MRKTLLIVVFIVMILCINKKESIKIPKESIRFRIIANSNIEEDQKIKKEIAQNVFEELTPIKNFRNIQETRDYLVEKLPTFEKIVDKTLKENNKNTVFHINYGKNIFPEKTYQNITYEEGEYESLVITLGDGCGENFWCVLFPPICFIEEEEDIEYSSWFKELFDKYF